MESTDQTHLFINGRPTEKWFYSFTKRYPDLRARIAQNVASDRAKTVSPIIIKDFFEKLHNLIETYGIQPEDMFNTDESGYQCDPGNFLNHNC